MMAGAAHTMHMDSKHGGMDVHQYTNRPLCEYVQVCLFAIPIRFVVGTCYYQKTT